MTLCYTSHPGIWTSLIFWLHPHEMYLHFVYSRCDSSNRDIASPTAILLSCKAIPKIGSSTRWRASVLFTEVPLSKTLRQLWGTLSLWLERHCDLCGKTVSPVQECVACHAQRKVQLWLCLPLWSQNKTDNVRRGLWPSSIHAEEFLSDKRRFQ